MAITNSYRNADDYFQYILLDYRQRLLRILLITCLVILLMLSVLNALDWWKDPQGEWSVYDLVVDGAALAAFLLMWWLNEKGHVEHVGWAFGLVVFLTIPATYTSPFFSQALLLMAVPAAVSSFTIQPWTAFLFTFLEVGAYVFDYIRTSGGFPFDGFSLIALCLLAIGSFVVATMLNTIIRDLVRAYDETIQGWATALEMRDSETHGHSQRVVGLTVALAKKLGVKGVDLFHIRRGVLLHDIGKMSVPDAILQKPGSLSDEELAVMRRHPQDARIALSKVSYLKKSIDIPYCHHEKWDGSGYPEGLKGESIPYFARIFAIVDVWDALVSDRPYRKAWRPEQVLDYIREQSGRHFDPAVVDAFVDLMQPERSTTLSG